MARSRRMVVVTLGLFGLLGTAAGCDGLGGGDQRGALAVTVVDQHPAPDAGASTTTVVDEHPDAGATTVVDDHDAGPPPCGDYEAMCRHYCETLRQGALYACLANGGTIDGCTTQGSIYDQCYDLRCAPMRVQPSLCLQQCDVLAKSYGSFCVSAAADPAQCATGTDALDSSCRMGCGVCLIP